MLIKRRTYAGLASRSIQGLARQRARFPLASIVMSLAAAYAQACVETTPEEPEPLCMTGVRRSCVHASGCIAEMSCRDPREGFSTCECRQDDAGPMPREGIGLPCSTDSECPTGGFCLVGTAHPIFGGTVREGSCAADCTQSPAACAQFAAATCVDTGERHYCLRTCEQGNATARCGQDGSLACEESSRGDYCRPLCASHADCPEGLCDPRNGVCITVFADGGLPEADLGEPCNSEDAFACQGLCVDVPDSFALCSHRCVYGSSGDCGLSEDIRGACLVASPGGLVGDVGYCLPVCHDDADCSPFGRRCEPFDDEILERAFQARGACTTSAADAGV